MAGRIALVIGSLLFGLIVLELGVRLARGPEWLVRWPNLVLQERIGTKAAGASRLVYDSRLGFAARPGFSAGDLTYDQRGFRVTPAPASQMLAEPPILVVGDSYAHGDEVADGETWAALLQPLVRRRVVNGAFSGYGFDQIVLRAETGAADLKPAAIILSFIADDLRRSEMKRVWGAEKPYFELVNGAAVLRNVPVPPSPAPRATLTPAQWVLGYSLLVDTVLRHQGWQYEWALDHERAIPRGDGERLACLLLKRVATLGLPTLVVAEYDPWLWQDADNAREQRRVTGLVLKCAADAGLATLDLFDTMDAAVKAQGRDAIYRSLHPSPAGTKLAAEKIAAAFTNLYIPPAR